MESAIKIAVLGEAGVGKSALVVRSITGRFLHHYDPTLEDEYRCQKLVNGQLRPVAVMDTAGQESNHLEYYFNWADVLLVAFSLDSRSSFNYATRLLQFSSNSRPPVLLLGTKQDLKGEREVSFDEAKHLAEELSIPYMETSAATNLNVKEAFVLATEMGTISRMQQEVFLTESLLEDSGYHSSMERKDSAKQEKTLTRRFSVKGLVQKWKNTRKEKKLLDSLNAHTG